jgi:hypothetical protein
MSTVVPLTRPAEPDRISVLEAQVVALTARLAEFETRLPRKRFTIPHGWIGFKAAVDMSGFSRSTLYRRIKRGEVVAVKVGVLTAVDPATLTLSTVSTDAPMLRARKSFE